MYVWREYPNEIHLALVLLVYLNIALAMLYAVINLACLILYPYIKVGHHWPTSETPFKWRFAGGPIVARESMLAG